MTNPFIPSSTDTAMQLLHMIFGDVINQMVSGGAIQGTVTTASTMLAAAFRYFDSGVLVFGALIMTGVTVFGVSNSANDGEVLGKTWNTFYTPIRSISAAAALIPSSSGYATVQIMLLYVVAWSIGFASNLWTAVVQAGLTADVAATAAHSIADDTNFNPAMAQAIRMGTCAAAMNKAFAALGQSTQLVWAATDLDDTHMGMRTTGYRYFYADPHVPGSDSLCGSITLTDTQPVIDSSSVFADTPFTGSTQGTAAAQALHSAIWNARSQFYATAFQSWVPAEVTTIMSAADSGTTLSATDLANTLASYRTELTQQIQSQAQSVIGNSSSGLASQLTSQGWVMAGSYWSDMARIKDTITNAGSAAALTAPPSTMAREGFFGSGDMLNSVEGITTRYEVLADELTKQALANPASTSSDPNAQVLPTFQSDFSLNDFTAGDQGVRETFTRIFNYIPGLVVRRVVGAMNTSDDPLMTVKNVGDSITALANAVLFWKGAVTAILSGLGAAAASSSIPGTSALAGIVQGMYTWFTQTFGFLSPGLWGLLYIGYWLGIWLPMVPFYVFAIGVVGWLVFVVEMMAAGMLWAAAHTTPARNNSFIGSQMQGYLLVMSGFFRPALMVLGLVASNALLGPAVSFINAAFIAKFTSMTQDSLTMITGVAAYLLSYAFLVTSTFMLVFGLPQSLPDRILRWIGAGIGDLGEQDTTARVERQAGNNSRNAILQGIKHAADKRNNERGSDTPKTAPTADSDREAERAAALMTDTGPVPLLEQGGGERT